MGASPAEAATDRSLWHVDQQAMRQGLSAAVLGRVTGMEARRTAIWQAVDALAARQPILSSLDAEGLAAIYDMVVKLRQKADTLVVIGTGGASLGAQALCAFAAKPLNVYFLENCDAQTVHDMLSQRAPERTAWAVISKSGETVETLATSLALMAHYRTAGVSLVGRIVAITSPGARPLRALAEQEDWPVLDHPPELGGRYSVFSVVGLLPVAFAGIDIAGLMHEARSVWNMLFHTHDTTVFEAAAVFAASIAEQPLHVVMGYADRLRPYTQWYKQLWAESLGKGGDGPTPITAIGAIDQHSQLQLYLDGKRDKIFTLILPEGAGAAVPLAACDIPALSYLGTQSMQDIMHASAGATRDTLKANGLPVRTVSGPLSVNSMATLMVRTVMETLLVAVMLDVDPYSQPAVEEGKQRARTALGKTT